MLTFGKLFHIYKLIHIDLKPRILIASFLLAPLLNDYVKKFLFLGLVFLRKKRKELFLVMELNAKQMFLRCFSDNTVKIFQ